MKVKFNLPVKRYNSKISFDNNTTLGVGNLQPLFCKFVLPKSKFRCNMAQLTRLSPLVVPTFARLKQVNDFVFIPINKIFPGFDALLSSTPVSGFDKYYTPVSVPCITNERLFGNLIEHFAWVNSYKSDDCSDFKASFGFTDYTRQVTINTNSTVVDKDKLSHIATDFTFVDRIDATRTVVVKLTQQGRFWLSVLRGLGYSVDINDKRPVSALPLFAFAKAYYDIYYPKRYNSWQSSNYYKLINNFYNGAFQTYSYDGHDYQMVYQPLLVNLFGDGNTFWAYGVLDNDVINACLATPLNHTITDGVTSLSGVSSATSSTVSQGKNGIPGCSFDTADDSSTLSADTISLADKLWHFVSRSSVVGQSVKDWFKVHFGSSPQDDMFDSCVCFAQRPNIISINSVVSTANTGSDGSQLGDLAGQGFSTSQDSVSFDVPSFGFIMCFSGIVPQSRVSGGTQPELYKTTYFDMPFPDFDGLGYEVLNQSSFIDNSLHGSVPTGSSAYSQGYGYVPQLTSFKTLNNFRSGCFALPSLIDQYLPYCEDTVIDFRFGSQQPLPSPTNLKAFFPWRYVGNFISYNRIFYNQFSYDENIKETFIDDNFMSQTAFDFEISSYLKPISDSYSIEELGKQVVSVHRQ